MEKFSLKKFKSLKTKEEVEEYFITIDITNINDKIEALIQGTNSSQVDYFEHNPTLDTQYKTLLTMFLNTEFRFIRGIDLETD